MNNEINIAALLKGCPKGTKLYSPICGECTLDAVSDDHILVNGIHDYCFDNHGIHCVGGECLLFPSKEVRDWGCFHVKYIKMPSDMTFGDIREVDRILEENGGKKSNKNLTAVENTVWYIDAVDKEIKMSLSNPNRAYILSTGTELKLEEEKQPKFKVGDVVKDDEDSCAVVTEHEVKGEVFISMQDASNPNCGIVGIATPEEIDKWNEETLQPNHLHYSKSKRKIIDWFLPFDKVVVRNDNVWYSRLFDSYLKNSKTGFCYVCQDGLAYRHCYPYDEETAKLIRTTDDYEEE